MKIFNFIFGIMMFSTIALADNSTEGNIVKNPYNWAIGLIVWSFVLLLIFVWLGYRFIRWRKRAKTPELAEEFTEEFETPEKQEAQTTIINLQGEQITEVNQMSEEETQPEETQTEAPEEKKEETQPEAPEEKKEETQVNKEDVSEESQENKEEQPEEKKEEDANTN